jgi:4'-phosphopantetheinyl transferase
MLWPLLSTNEKERANRFYFAHDRHYFTVARGVLRKLLSSYIQTDPAAIEFSYNNHGKPELASVHKVNGNQMTFNLSHSHGLALVGISVNRVIGIDIEPVRPLDDGKEIARRFFSKWEYEQFTAVSPHDQPQAFFNCWTRKEAYIKAIGDGLSCPLDSFDVTLTPGEPAKLLRILSSSTKAAQWQLHHLEPEPGFVGAVIAATPPWKLSQFKWPNS